MSRSRGQIIPKGAGKWLIKAFLGVREGRRVYSSKIIRGTAQEARQGLTGMLREVDTQTFVRPTKTVLSLYLAGWLDGKIDITGSTLASYRRQAGYFVRAIGHLKLGEVSNKAIQDVLTGMAAQGLSRRTLEYARAVLHAALADATRQGLLAKNPADYLKLPPKIKRPPSVLAMEQVSKLLEVTATDPMAPLWRLLLTTALRPGEALALLWGDLNVEDRWLSVRRTLVDDGHGKVSLVEATKTDGSTRRIGLPESTVEALRDHKKRQSTAILQAGEKYNRLGLIFANELGRPMDHSAVRRRWKAALKTAGLPQVRLYDTRHTHLTALLAAGADLAWVAARAGHSDVSLTASTYAHVLPEVHKAMGEMTERMLQKVSR
jgi:integrase